MDNDNTFLVVKVKENGQVVLAGKLKFVTMDLSKFGQKVREGQWIRVDRGSLRVIAPVFAGAKMVNGKLEVSTEIEGAYDDEDVEYRGLLKTEYFLKVARGNMHPVDNDNQLKGLRVTMKFNSQGQCWEVVHVHSKYTLSGSSGLVYSMLGDQHVRLYVPGWPVDFQLDCENEDRAKLLGKWFGFAFPDDFKTLKWRDVQLASEPRMETLRDGDVVMIRLPIMFSRENRSLRTERNELVMDMYGSLTRFFEEIDEGAVERTTLELWPLNNGAVRMMAHIKKPLIVGEKNTGGFTQTPWPGVIQTPRFDGKAPNGEKVKEHSEPSKKETTLIGANEEFEELSNKIQMQQQLAEELYLTVTKCSEKIPDKVAEEIEKGYIQLTIYESILFCGSESVNDVREKIIVLKEGFGKYEEFFKKANSAILRSGRVNIPNAAKAFLANLKKKFK